jgi:hypothetical protein
MGGSSNNNKIKVSPKNSIDDTNGKSNGDDDEIEKIEEDLNKKIDELSYSKTRNALYSVFGLIVICCIAGLIFNAIESPEEIKYIKEYDRHTRKPIDKYLNNILALTTKEIDELNETTMVNMLKTIQEDTKDQKSLVNTMKQLMEGEISAAPKSAKTGNWGIASSIFFSLTIVSTIGYGAFTASTGTGKAFTVVLAVFGK